MNAGMDQGTPNTANEPFRCPICHKEYNIRSSYLRHSKQCLENSVSSPRQKSCRQCSKAKARCDQRRPSCSRCSSRNDSCDYTTSTARQRQISINASTRSSRNRDELSPNTNANTNIPSLIDNDIDFGNDQTIETSYFSNSSNIGAHTVNNNTLLTSTSNLTRSSQQGSSPENALEPEGLSSGTTQSYRISPPQSTSANDSISSMRERWLYPYLEQSPPSVVALKHSVSLLCRVFRTYPRMMSRNVQLPPFIHEAQMSDGNVPLPLSNCFALSRMWNGHTDTGGFSNIVQTTIRTEMDKLINEYPTYDSETLTAAFQALLIYSIIMLFPVPQTPSFGVFDLSTLASLHELGFYITKQGLILAAETDHIRPPWNEWVQICCRRKTLMVLYCFEGMYHTLNNLPTFPCTELEFLPAPAGKVLWNAKTQQDWESAYDRWLGHWAGNDMFIMKDLEVIQPGADLTRRAEMWLEEADEFGMMFMSMVNASAGSHVPEAEVS